MLFHEVLEGVLIEGGSRHSESFHCVPQLADVLGYVLVCFCSGCAQKLVSTDDEGWNPEIAVQRHASWYSLDFSGRWTGDGLRVEAVRLQASSCSVSCSGSCDVCFAAPQLSQTVFFCQDPEFLTRRAETPDHQP